jgi:hypothetical protein
MQLPHLKKCDRYSAPSASEPSGRSNGSAGSDRVVEPCAHAPQPEKERGANDLARGHLADARDDFDRAMEIDPADCVAYISRGNSRYQKQDPGCEADYRAAFLLDAELATLEFVRRLEGDIRDDIAYVLMNCRKRLKNDPRDVVARARLGLTLLLLHQDSEALLDLQQIFLQSPAWRPFLRLLVNEAKRRRAIEPVRPTWGL